MNNCERFLFSEKEKCERNVLLYFILSSASTFLILLGLDDPDKFVHIMKLPINNKVNFPLFLTICIGIFLMLGGYYAIKKYRGMHKIENEEYLTMALENSSSRTRIDDDPAYEADQENSWRIN